MDLRQLEYFVRVAELGSFTRAALALNVAQPALSRQVRLLEVELRHNLLQRNGRGAAPTEAGQLLLEHARGILHQVERAREELARLRGGLAGRVTLGLPPSVARVLAVPLVHDFHQQLPEARLAITEALSASMQEQLVSGRLDLAVLYNAHPVPDLEIARLASDELVLVRHRTDIAPPLQAIHLPELARLPLIIPSRPNAIRIYMEAQLAAVGEARRGVDQRGEGLGVGDVDDEGVEGQLPLRRGGRWRALRRGRRRPRRALGGGALGQSGEVDRATQRGGVERLRSHAAIVTPARAGQNRAGSR